MTATLIVLATMGIMALPAIVHDVFPSCPILTKLSIILLAIVAIVFVIGAFLSKC